MAPEKHRHHHALLIFFCLFLFSELHLSSSESGQLYADQQNRSTHCSHKKLPLDARCKLEYPEKGCPIWGPAYRSGGYMYPLRVMDVKVKPAYLGPFNGTCYTGIRVSFKLPKTNLEFLKGVEVKVFLMDGRLAEWCFVFNLTEANLDDLLHDGVQYEAILGYFNDTYYSISQGSQQRFIVTVSSLPQKDDVISREVMSYPWGGTCLPGPKPKKCTQRWHDYLRVTVYHNSANIEMACLPEGFYYVVDLIWRGNQWNYESLNSTEDLGEGEWEVTFTNIAPGNHQFRVMVMEVNGDCVDFNMFKDRAQNEGRFRTCSAKSKDFNITMATIPTAPHLTFRANVTPPSDESRGKTIPLKTSVLAIILSCVGVVIAIVVGVVLISLIRGQRRAERGSQPISRPSGIEMTLYDRFSEAEVENAPLGHHDPLDSVSTTQNLLPNDSYSHCQVDSTKPFQDSGVSTPDSAMIGPEFNHVHGDVFYEPVPLPFPHHDPHRAPSIISDATNVTDMMNCMLPHTAEVHPRVSEIEAPGAPASDHGIATDAESVSSNETL